MVLLESLVRNVLLRIQFVVHVPCISRSKMKLVQFLSRYAKWFHIFGQSSYSYFDGFLIENGCRGLRYRIWNFLPSIMLLVLSTFFTVVTYVLLLDFGYYNNLGYPVVALNASTQLLTIFVAVGQSIFLSPHCAQLFAQIRVVDQMEHRKFSIDLPAFRCSLLKRFILTGSAYLLALTVTFIIKSVSWSNVAVFMSLFILRSLTVLIIFHMVFYIDLFECIIRAFVQYVEQQATTTITTSAVSIVNVQDGDIRHLMSEFHFIKFMHLHMWEISQTINNLFGWTLIVICLQYFSYAIYCVYFSLILMISSTSNAAEILRNLNLQFYRTDHEDRIHGHTSLSINLFHL